MRDIEIIKCHGSGNDFVMVDATKCAVLQSVDWSAFARYVSDRKGVIGSDGVLLLVRHDDGVYGMDMLNPDGTHAEMCGNGIRCVARLAAERGYIGANGILRSGGCDYHVGSAKPLAEGIECFSVDIPVKLWSRSFAFYGCDDSFVGRVISDLDHDLCFTALNLGNPHIVAKVDSIDMSLLESLGKRVKQLKELFPEGVNVSLYECRSREELSVATYERGAGITLSCGTAMTASATAAMLLGYTDEGARVKVRNRGGVVYCTSKRMDCIALTKLEGNATFEWSGLASIEDDSFSCVKSTTTEEGAAWDNFVKTINR